MKYRMTLLRKDLPDPVHEMINQYDVWNGFLVYVVNDDNGYLTRSFVPVNVVSEFTTVEIPDSDL